jgi:hypothetical protein
MFKLLGASLQQSNGSSEPALSEPGIKRNNNKKYLETIPGKHSVDSLQKNGCTRNITHYKESATIRNLKPEWWGSPLVQEVKYKENPLKREIIVIIIIIEGTYIAETLNLVECVENKEDSLIQIVRTHQHNTNSALLQTANKFKKSFQNEANQLKEYNNSEYKRKMGRKNDAWTISTQLR